MDRLVLVARLKPDSQERARELLAERRDPGALEAAFDRWAVFMSESEIIFFFEGRDVDKAVTAMLNDPVRSTAISPWLPLFDGPLHSAPEADFWERDGGRRS